MFFLMKILFKMISDDFRMISIIFQPLYGFDEKLNSSAVALQNTNVELIWASPRELYNVVQADSIGCHIITATNNILKKLPNLGKDLTQFSLETVKMFYDDATQAGFNI